MIFLIACIFAVALYSAHKAASIEKRQASIAEFLEAQLKDIKAGQEKQPKVLAYGWFDDGWPVPRTREEISVPLENPEPHRNPDDYETQMWVHEYQSMGDAHGRKEILRQLFKAGAWMKPEFLDMIYADENTYVRAWAAAHLHLDFKDDSDSKNPRELRDYEPALLNDPDPLVRAAVWSNPECKRLPFGMYGIDLSEDWKAQFRSMGALERLALMRNPHLPGSYVLALLETPSEELGISREEHVRILTTAAANPNLVGNSRRTGRDYWMGRFGDPFRACEEYGKMWKLSLEKWFGTAVLYMFVKYIQTTPEVKLTTYNCLLEKNDGNDHKWLRQELIRSCDPIVDSKVLKLAWDDPDKDCRSLAEERVGQFTAYVGVKKTG